MAGRSGKSGLGSGSGSGGVGASGVTLLSRQARQEPKEKLARLAFLARYIPSRHFGTASGQAEIIRTQSALRTQRKPGVLGVLSVTFQSVIWVQHQVM